MGRPSLGRELGHVRSLQGFRGSQSDTGRLRMAGRLTKLVAPVHPCPIRENSSMNSEGNDHGRDRSEESRHAGRGSDTRKDENRRRARRRYRGRPLHVEPGWKWSECIKPVVKTDSCQAEHLGTVISGRLRVVHNDGTQVDVSAGDAYFIAPGHDAWVLGDEQFVGIEFKSAATYAKS